MASFDFKELDSSFVCVHGSLDFDDRPEGLGVRRLPKWTRSQVPQGLDVMARMPSGVRIQLFTNASEIAIEALTTTFRFEDGKPASVPFQLQIGDTLYTQFMSRGHYIKPDESSPNGFELVRGEPEVISFSDLPNGEKYCEIWLPHNAYVTLRRLEINDSASLLPLPTESRKRWIHYGSSISHCMEAKLPSETWPAVAARRAGLSLMSFGVGGQCHLDQFVARTIREQDCDFISMKIGINIINMDSMKERVFTPAMHGFLDTIREKQPRTPILVISPIYCPSAETHPGPTIPDGNGKFRTNETNLNTGSMTLTRVREILRDVVERRRAEGDVNIDYFNGLELFAEPDRVDLPDDLHPNPAGYIRMGDRFYEKYLEKFVPQL